MFVTLWGSVFCSHLLHSVHLAIHACGLQHLEFLVNIVLKTASEESQGGVKCRVTKLTRNVNYISYDSYALVKI